MLCLGQLQNFPARKRVDELFRYLDDVSEAHVHAFPFHVSLGHREMKTGGICQFLRSFFHGYSATLEFKITSSETCANNFI